MRKLLSIIISFYTRVTDKVSEYLWRKRLVKRLQKSSSYSLPEPDKDITNICDHMAPDDFQVVPGAAQRKIAKLTPDDVSKIKGVDLDDLLNHLPVIDEDEEILEETPKVDSGPKRAFTYNLKDSQGQSTGDVTIWVEPPRGRNFRPIVDFIRDLDDFKDGDNAVLE